MDIAAVSEALAEDLVDSIMTEGVVGHMFVVGAAVSLPVPKCRVTRHPNIPQDLTMLSRRQAKRRWQRTMVTNRSSNDRILLRHRRKPPVSVVAVMPSIHRHTVADNPLIQPPLNSSSSPLVRASMLEVCRLPR